MSSASGVLWASPVTTCSRRAIAACVEAGASWSFVPIHLPKAEQKLPAFTALNPYGKVPAWRDAEGFDLYESRAIMQHVCEGTPLIPSTAKERALMNQWLWVDQCSFKPAFDPIFYQKVLKKVPPLCSSSSDSRPSHTACKTDHKNRCRSTSSSAQRARSSWRRRSTTWRRR